MNFATSFMPRSCIKISDREFFGIPRSASSSHTANQSPIFVDCSPYMFNILRCSAHCRPSRTWITLNRFLAIFEAFVSHYYLCCTHRIIPECLLNHPNSFCRGMLKLNTKFDADLLLYLVILNVTATQYTCSFNGVYCPH